MITLCVTTRAEFSREMKRAADNQDAGPDKKRLRLDLNDYTSFIQVHKIWYSAINLCTGD